MYTLAADEKKSLVMIYTHNSLIRGELITKENVRVSLWLRTQGAPQYIHLLNARVLLFGGTPPKPLSYAEMYFPTAQIIAFHLARPASEALNYDAKEANRMMVDVDAIIGAFVAKGKIRISSQADLMTAIEVARAAWGSVYDAEISNPFLPQMPSIHVPMLLVSPTNVSYSR
jgi:hypothetical protein